MSHQQEDARYGDLPPCWNYCEPQEPSNTASSFNQQLPPPHPHMYAGEAFPRSYAAAGAVAPDATVDAARVNRFPNYALLQLTNGRLVGKVVYDENMQRRIVIPVDNQYELFEPASPDLASSAFAAADFPGASCQPEFPPRPAVAHHAAYTNSETTSSNFIKDVIGNWEPNVSGTYSPFGQRYPLNHPSASAPTIAHEDNNATDEAKLVSSQKNVSPPRRSEQTPLADTGRKRIIAEVKPMRPSYSDVLAKNNKTSPTVEVAKKTKSQLGNDVSVKIKNGPVKISPINNKQSEETKNNEKGKTNVRSPQSSGSDSGDLNAEEVEKSSRKGKRSKTKTSNFSGSWSSLNNGNHDDGPVFEPTSDFVFVQNQTEKAPKKSKKEKSKNEKYVDTEEEASLGNNDDCAVRENPSENAKIKKKSKEKSSGSSKVPKASEKKKTVSKVKRSKASGYLGVVQGYVERWSTATFKAFFWFWYLLSDICHMSAHLSFDLLTSVFTQTYVSCQAVWRGSREWAGKLRESKYLLYVDKKLGHTPLGFWRKIKWFKKEKEQPEPNDGSKTNSNIPLPATGEEAMKRLLACKGKDPYSILGVKVSCTDEEIKRYYRRQAFLVHPDKNQQPGAEEAFKILQHAFDLIGEPERREAFDRRTLEHRHVEAAWSELSTLLAQLHDKMEVAANTIRCTNCGRRHKRVITDRPCYAARYCAQCKIRHSAKEGDIWAESGMWGLLVMYYACMDGAVYQITQWASCQKKNLRQLKPNCHVVQYRIVLGNKAGAAPNLNQQRSSTGGSDPNLEEFLNNLYGTSRPSPGPGPPPPPADTLDPKARRRTKKTKA